LGHARSINNFNVERPAMTTVYFEERDHLNQHTQYLHRAGLLTPVAPIRENINMFPLMIVPPIQIKKMQERASMKELLVANNTQLIQEEKVTEDEMGLNGGVIDQEINISIVEVHFQINKIF
jgi:hypothetical protein